MTLGQILAYTNQQSNVVKSTCYKTGDTASVFNITSNCVKLNTINVGLAALVPMVDTQLLKTGDVLVAGFGLDINVAIVPETLNDKAIASRDVLMLRVQNYPPVLLLAFLLSQSKSIAVISQNSIHHNRWNLQAIKQLVVPNPPSIEPTGQAIKVLDRAVELIEKEAHAMQLLHKLLASLAHQVTIGKIPV